MDFSNNAFQNHVTSKPASSTLSNDAQMVMACRFGWNAGPENSLQNPITSQYVPLQPPLVRFSNEPRSRRFTPCRGRLYHQLTCSHRIRTDLVEDCGSNCLDPLNNTSAPPFYCHECVESRVSKIWSEREAQHNATYPPISQMTKEQYELWYQEHRQLEAQLSRDRKIYELDLKAKTRPSNICSALEASREEMDFAAELGTLSLAMVSSNESIKNQPQSRLRTSLPNDTSEQLHWGLNALSLDRGACGLEFATNSPSIARAMTEEELWRSPRGRD